jgi:hypothetical protein
MERLTVPTEIPADPEDISNEIVSVRPGATKLYKRQDIEADVAFAARFKVMVSLTGAGKVSYVVP